VAKSSTRSARIWSVLASKPPETYPLTVWNQGGELLNASQRVTFFLTRSTHQRWPASADQSQCSGLSGFHQSVSCLVVPSGAFQKPSIVAPVFM
jgi:hypothetical protein